MIGLGSAEIEAAHRERGDARDPVGAVGQTLQLHQKDVDDLVDPQGGHGQVVALEPQGGHADQTRDDSRQHRGQEHGQPRIQPQPRREDRGPVCPYADESRLPQRDLPRLSHKQTQPQRHHEAGGHEGENRQVVRIAQVRGDGHHDHRDHQEAGVLAQIGEGRRHLLHCRFTTFAPRSPAGRMNRTRRRMTKAMASL